MSGKPRVFITQPIAQSALDRLRTIADVKMNPELEQDPCPEQAARGGEEMRYSVFAAA